MEILYIFQTRMSIIICFKLKAFLIRFSTANPFATKNRYLLPQSAPPISDITQTQDYPATADSDKLNAHKYSDDLQQGDTKKSSKVQPIKQVDISKLKKQYDSKK